MLGSLWSYVTGEGFAPLMAQFLLALVIMGIWYVLQLRAPRPAPPREVFVGPHAPEPQFYTRLHRWIVEMVLLIALVHFGYTFLKWLFSAGH